MDKITAIKLTTIFFYERFPEKQFSFFYNDQYFNEWVERFESGHMDVFMDNTSLKVWMRIKKRLNIDNDF